MELNILSLPGEFGTFAIYAMVTRQDMEIENSDIWL